MSEMYKGLSKKGPRGQIEVDSTKIDAVSDRNIRFMKESQFWKAKSKLYTIVYYRFQKGPFLLPPYELFLKIVQKRAQLPYLQLSSLYCGT
jgi:hypothetical protein